MLSLWRWLSALDEVCSFGWIEHVSCIGPYAPTIFIFSITLIFIIRIFALLRYLFRACYNQFLDLIVEAFTFGLGRGGPGSGRRRLLLLHLSLGSCLFCPLSLVMRLYLRLFLLLLVVQDLG